MIGLVSYRLVRSNSTVSRSRVEVHMHTIDDAMAHRCANVTTTKNTHARTDKDNTISPGKAQ